MLRRVVVTTLIALLVLAAASTAGTDLLDDLRRQLQTGDLDAALVTARKATDAGSALPGLWYNLAGLEAHHGHGEAAVAAFERAVVLGFDDFRHADADADLVALRVHPRYGQLREAWADGLARQRRDHALELTAGAWSEIISLTQLQAGLEPISADLRLKPDADGLQVELNLAGPELPPAPPWRGGGGVLMSLTLPADPQTGEGSQGVDLGFGWQDDLPAGSVRLGTHWQRLADLGPKMRLNHADQRLHMSFRIPWSVCGSLHPLADPELSLNVAYVHHLDGAPVSAALLPDPGLGRADRPWRRGVPLRVTWPSDTPAVQGHLDEHVIRDGRMTVGAGALLPARHDGGDVHVVLRDRRGDLVSDLHSDLQRDGSRWRATTAVAVMAPAGSARLGVSLGSNTARALASWETTVAVIPEGWEELTRRRMAAAPLREQPSLQLRYLAITESLAHRRPRDDVGALATTLDELEAMLARLEAHGTTLPSGGVFLAAAPSTDGGKPLACSLYLPPDWRRGHTTPVLLLLARAPGAEERAVSLVARLLAQHTDGDAVPDLAVAMAHLPTEHRPGQARDTADGLVTWLRRFLDCGPVHLAAVDLLAASALELSSQRADDLAGLLLLTGVGFSPYPEDGPDDLAARVADVPANLPVGWIWFPDEMGPGDQSRALRRALKDQGHVLTPRRSVRGGLRFDQAWMRAALWAAGIQ